MTCRRLSSARVSAFSRTARIPLPDGELFAVTAGAGEFRYGACCEGGPLWEVRYREAHCEESAVENLLNATSI